MYVITNLISKQIWEDRYKKHNETFDESLRRVANYIGQNDKEKEMFFNVMNDGLFYPAGRTMSNSGIGKDLTLNNCFTLNLVPDSMEGIFEYVKYGAMTQKVGGGTGYNFSLIRPKGSSTSNEAVASGVVSFINVFDAQTHTVLQGSRRGANMGCLCIYHPDIYDFLESKSWDEGKLVHFNLSVLVDDDFMNAVKNNEKIYLRYPCMTEEGEIIKDENKWSVKKEVNARELWDMIITKAYNTGEYGVLYYDNMNRDNNIGYMENIVTTNPCAEYVSGVLYTEEGVKYNHFGACNLGSLFLHNFVKNPFTINAEIDYDKLNSTIRIGVRMLDNIIDINNYPLENYENYQKNVRTIGLGITGLADLLVMMNVVYGSKESIDLIDDLMNFITAIAYDESCELAKEKGSFNYLNREKFVESNFIKKHIKKDKSWEYIKEKILKYGIRNARLISVAPTGTLSLSFGNNCSSGLEPIFSLEYERKIKVGGQDEEHERIYKMRDYAYDKWLEFNKEDNIVKKETFVTAMDLNVQSHIDVLEIIAFHTDMSCSKTINVPSDYPYEDTKDIYIQCWEKGIKGCTIFRPNELRSGILITEKETEQEDEQEITLKRGQWKSLAEDTYYLKRNLTIGCGKLKLFVGVSPSEKNIQDIYITKCGSGGCEKNLQCIAILISSVLRIGGNLDQIEKSFSGVSACPSFTRERGKGIHLSNGSYCGMAILKEMKEVIKELGFDKEIVEESPIKVNKEKEDKKEVFTREEREFIEKNGDSAFAQAFGKCPKCGKKIERVSGCIQCMNCSYTKCD